MSKKRHFKRKFKRNRVNPFLFDKYFNKTKLKGNKRKKRRRRKV